MKYILLFFIIIAPLKEIGIANVFGNESKTVFKENTEENIEYIEDVYCLLHKTDDIKMISGWPTDILLAAYINTECENCFSHSSEEKKALIYMLCKRANGNFDGFGKDLLDQLAAQKQFAAIRSNMSIHPKFFFDPELEHHIDNLNAARTVLSGYKPSYIPDDSWYFMLPSAKPVRAKHIRKSKKSGVPEYFNHIIF